MKYHYKQYQWLRMRLAAAAAGEKKCEENDYQYQ